MTTRLFGKVLVVAGAVAAVAAVSVSVYLNPPSAVKAQALDDQRMQALQQINFAIRSYYHEHQALPHSIADVENNSGLSPRLDWTDPVTHRSYDYSVVGQNSYRLCADFAADSETAENPYTMSFRKHHKGHDCFEEDVGSGE
jgi:type II secretory pathway pseudopilin PulG